MLLRLLGMLTQPHFSLNSHNHSQSLLQKASIDVAMHIDQSDVTNSSSGGQRTISELVVGTMVFIIIIFTTIFGNILVIWAIFVYRPLKKVQNFFLVSLAVADLAVAVLVMPFHVMKFLRYDWPLGHVICILWITCDILLCTASILNLCAIAIDRYYAIHDPLHYANKRTKRLVLTVCGIVWALSALISVPPLLGWNDWETADMRTCAYTTAPGFVIYSALGSFYIPLLIMTVVYAKIFFAAKQRILKHSTLRRGISVVTNREVRRCSLEADSAESHPLTQVSAYTPRTSTDGNMVIRNDHASILSPSKVKAALKGDKLMGTLRRTARRKNNEITPEPEPENDLQAHFKEREKISLSKEKKAAKTLAIIMGVFVLCWLPFFVFYLMDSFIPNTIHPKIYEAANWLGYINSSLNPIIYTIFNMDFRKGFKKILFRRTAR